MPANRKRRHSLDHTSFKEKNDLNYSRAAFTPVTEAHAADLFYSATGSRVGNVTDHRRVVPNQEVGHCF